MPTKEELLDFSRFDLDAILRGVQLTFVGAQRALQNPGLWTTQHYRQAAMAVACGIAIRILVEIPVIFVKISLWLASFFVSLDAVTWDDTIADGLRFLQEYVLQVPLFMMTLMRHVTPAMDELFMQSLQWVDFTYAQKHARDAAAANASASASASAAAEKGSTSDGSAGAAALVDPRNRYYENLRVYAQVSKASKSSSGSGSSKQSIARFLWRFGRKAAISLAVFALSYVPIVGRFVLPATSFLTFRRAVGLGPAALIFGTGLFLPRRYLVVFLQTYFGQRSLMRELLGPYFSRVRFSAAQKRAWFSSREGILFGFGAGFYLLLRVPLVGVLVYGIAEASTAYLVTKITDPPPGRDLVLATATTRAGTAAQAAVVAGFAESQQTWHNKKAFLELALDNLDALQQQKRHADQPVDARTGAATSASYEQPGVANTPQHRVATSGGAGQEPAPPPYSE